MKSFSVVLEQRLKKLDKAFQRRTLSPRQGFDFSSNDYLGFSRETGLRDRILQRWTEEAVGASGARLLRGHSRLFEGVEHRLAQFSGREAALIFPSGYQANCALLSALLTPEDTVFSDQLNHASLIDGIRLSKAERVVFPHRDLGALRQALADRSDKAGLRVIVTESVFGMDGTQAPLAQLAVLAEEFGALLVVDQAHATGLWGAGGNGGGLVQELRLTDQVFATVHTGGKALGVGGAWVAGSEQLRDYLVNFSRPFIFSTAPIPGLVVSLGESIRYWREVGKGRAAILFNVERVKSVLTQSSLGELDFSSLDPSPIVPVILGSNARAIQVASNLREQGFDVRAIRPPTVPEGTARLRLSIHWDHTPELLQKLCLQICEAAERS